MKKYISFLFHKYFWINLGIFIGLLIVTALIVLYSLKKITKWGQSSTIPNVEKMHLEDAEDKIYDARLEFEIKDTVYRRDLEEGTIVEVQPEPGLEIKEGKIGRASCRERVYAPV